MQEDFGPNFITLTDEDGNDFELEYVDALELNGQTYMAFFLPWKRAPMRTVRTTAS